MHLEYSFYFNNAQYVYFLFYQYLYYEHFGESKVELRLSSVVSILFLIKSISSCYYFGHLALCVVFVDSDVDVFRR